MRLPGAFAFRFSRRRGAASRPISRQERYYRLTTVLSNRGMQSKVSRAIAAATASLGVVPLVLLASPTGPRSTTGRVLAITVTMCYILMALGWLRGRWPTRPESRSLVVAGAVCTAVACLVPATPGVGLLGVTAFAMLTGYAVSLHGIRLVAFVWTVSAATLAALGWRLGHGDLALLAGSVILVGAMNVFAAAACWVSVRLILADTETDEIEPLTGLLSRTGFYAHAGRLLGAGQRDEDRYLVLAVLNIDGYSLVTGMSGESGAVRAQVDVGSALKAISCHDAVVAHSSDAEFLIADTFATPDASAFVQRIRAAARLTPSRLTLSIGVVSTPLDPLRRVPLSDVLDEVIGLASTAMCKVRETGGDAVHFEITPRLTVNEPNHDAD